jgi:hypothetical protein
MILAIDPGAYTGWAFFYERALTTCGLSRPSRWFELTDCDAYAGYRPLVLIEQPTIYPHSKAPPASIMALQLKVGELKGRFEMVGCKVELVEPRVWKKQVPKTIHNARTRAALTAEELPLTVGMRHDVWDAIGLGLWKLGRLK